MKRILLVAAASLFVIGQAIAQNQPSGQQSSQPNAAQNERTQKAPRTARSSQMKSSHLSKVGRHAGMQRSAHRMPRHHGSRYAMRRTEPSQQSGFGPQPGWNQQQGWNWNQPTSDRPSRRSARIGSQEPQTSGFGGNWDQRYSDQPSRRSARTSSQEPQTTGFGWNWNQSGPCRNGRRSDGSWC